jgi:hypothetical protein
MTIEEVEEKLNELREQRCDCVLSKIASSTCAVCSDLYFYLKLKQELERIRNDERTA